MNSRRSGAEPGLAREFCWKAFGEVAALRACLGPGRERLCFLFIGWEVESCLKCMFGVSLIVPAGSTPQW